MADKAQKFLLDNNCGDLILNDKRAKNAKDRIYASDIMMKFLESERGQSNKPEVIKSVCECPSPTADSDKECCMVCGKFLYEDE